jgi:hypothetical protein
MTRAAIDEFGPFAAGNDDVVHDATKASIIVDTIATAERIHHTNTIRCNGTTLTF